MVDDAKSFKLDSSKVFDHFSLLLNLFCYLQISFNGSIEIVIFFSFLFFVEITLKNISILLKDD
jgi:hypothetical protein